MTDGGNGPWGGYWDFRAQGASGFPAAIGRELTAASGDLEVAAATLGAVAHDGWQGPAADAARVALEGVRARLAGADVGIADAQSMAALLVDEIDRELGCFLGGVG